MYVRLTGYIIIPWYCTCALLPICRAKRTKRAGFVVFRPPTVFRRGHRYVDYPYEAGANCPKWKSFLREVLPQEDTRKVLQEWFGYNLVFNTSQDKMAFFVGEGANGKSVVCFVLGRLLGKDSVSAVALDSFSAGRTFPMASMVGKKANIIEEVADIDKADESMLKIITSGGEIQLEEKYKDPRKERMTARLTFATNTPPRFRDRTDGIWRRVLYFL